MSESAVVSLTRDLVRFNTTNPPGRESAAIDLLAARMRDSGFETTVVPYEDEEGRPDRTQVVGRLRGSGERPGLLFSGHVDVVPAGETGWTADPFGGEVRDGRLYGRGSCDMKGGVSALMVAAEEVARSGRALRGDLVLAFTADEERNCLGAEVLAGDPLLHGLGSAIVAEPTALELYVAEKGAFWVEVVFHGKAAHGSLPHFGANAIAAMADFLTRWERRYRTDHPVHPLLGTPTLNVGVIRGGVKANVVADRCAAELDMRTVPPQQHAALLAHLRETVDEVCSLRKGIRGELAQLSDRPPVSCPVDSELVQALGSAVREIAGIDPTPKGIPYCTEACIWVPHLDIPAVICGPGSPKVMHQPDEHIELTQLEQAARIYARAAEHLLT